jgi:hypothetical protein
MTISGPPAGHLGISAAGDVQLDGQQALDCPKIGASLACQLLRLLLAARVAEYDIMPGPREQDPELAAHQP